MGKVIVVSIQKGGSGKTCTSVNLSCALASLGHKVALIDFDPQGDSGKCYGLSLAELKYSIFDVFLKNTDMKGIVRRAYGVDIYPARNDLIGLKQLAEDNPDIYPDYRYMLRDVLAEIRDKYDYIFVDLPPSQASQYMINGLTAADEILITMQCEYLATDAVETMLEEIEQARKNTNPGLKLMGVVATMYISGTVLSSDVVQESRKHFYETGIRMFQTVIPRSVRFGDAPRYRKPALVLYPKNDAVQSYMALAKEVIEL